jgi:putative ABC transport system permease protein
MKGKLYFSYTTRALRRGGSRTVLAVFCVTVGVMALVALQLVGLMVNAALTSNVREQNGGDVALFSGPAPLQLSQSDLSYFADLQAQGEITNFTPLTIQPASDLTPDGQTVRVLVQAINPATTSQSGAAYPLVGSLGLLQPAGGSADQVLDASPQNALLTKQLFDDLGAKLGNTLQVTTVNHVALTVRVAGELAQQGTFKSGQFVMLVTQAYYRSVAPPQEQFYNQVNITTPTPAQAAEVKRDVLERFSQANARTADDLLQVDQKGADLVRKFLEVVGLLALLIGGVGIVNTMQVQLRRRQTEIAMLKTTGYRRRDLYALFGLEAGLLGLTGGVVGALAGVGASYIFKRLVENAVQDQLPFVLDWPTVAAGVVVGVLTALIFGLLPIVKAAAIRPQNVLRELDEGRTSGNRALTIGLVALLSLLFGLLASAIMQNIPWGLGAAYGTLILLGLLGLGFALVVWVIGQLPVPERTTWKYLLLVSATVGVSLAITVIQPGFGVLLLVASLLGYAALFLPRPWKANIKLSLRNIGRQKTRTATTLVALFVGVFAIGLILALGQSLSADASSIGSPESPYNVLVSVPAAQRGQVEAELPGLPGLQSHSSATYTPVTPLCINGKLLKDWLGAPVQNADSGALSRVQGYDLSRFPNGLPSVSLATRSSAGVDLSTGRLLTSSDLGTRNIIAPESLADAPFHLRVGSQLLVRSSQTPGGTGQSTCAAFAGSQGTTTLTIVGFFTSGDATLTNYLLGGQDLAAGLGQQQTVYYLKISIDQVGLALRKLGQAVPDAFLQNLGDVGAVVQQSINEVITVLTSIAGLALLAGMIIIANAVGLAILERRRELGILKSVGYTSRAVLGLVLLEYGVIGGLGGLLAMALVSLALLILSQPALFGVALSNSVPLTLATVLCTALLAMAIATLVAWRATRVRPLEVLRYE